jgi:MFS transporter, DHA3 family, macrolide efflux protein
MQNKQALRLLFTANAISGFAQGMSMLSIPWYFAKNDATGTFNLFYALLTFLSLFWGLYAGTLVDRYSRKRVFLTTNFTEGLLVGFVALYCFIVGEAILPMVLLVFMVTMLGYYLHYPNMYAFIQEITEPEQYSKATSMIEIVGQSTTIVAGGLTALLLEGFDLNGIGINWHMPAWKIYHIFLLDAATYFIAFGLIAMLKYVPIKSTVVELGSLLNRLKSGFAYLKLHNDILIFGLLSYVVFMALLVELNALMPMYVKNHLQAGAGVFGVAEMFYASGALCSGLVARRLFSGLALPATVILFLLIAGLGFVLSAWTNDPISFYIWSFLIGLGNAGARIFRLSWLFRRVPNSLIGRINSVFSTANVLARTLLILLFSLPFFSQSNHVIWGYVLLGSLIWLSGMVLLFRYKSFVHNV